MIRYSPISIMRSDNIYYFGECEHGFETLNSLQNNDCRKRYYKFADVNSMSLMFVAVCNEWIRNSVHSRQHDYTTTNKRPCHTYEDLVTEIAGLVLGREVGSVHCFYGRNNVVNPEFHYLVCQRPYIYERMSLKEGLLKLIDAGGDYNFHAYSGFQENCINALIHLCEYWLSKSKYNKSRITISRALKVLVNHTDYKTEMHLNEVYQEIIEIFIHHKINENVISKQSKSKFAAHI